MKVTFDLPVKIGDVVYDCFGGVLEQGKVTGFSYGHLPVYEFGNAEDGLIVHCSETTGDSYFPLSELGKIVFLSLEEAEKHLGK